MSFVSRDFKVGFQSVYPSQKNQNPTETGPDFSSSLKEEINYLHGNMALEVTMLSTW